MAKFSYRIFRQGGDILLAISDSSILGKAFEEGETSITVSQGFYGGKLCSGAEAEKLIRGATIVNAVGKDIVGLMLKKRMLDESMILEIAGVPHAQIISVQ